MRIPLGEDGALKPDDAAAVADSIARPEILRAAGRPCSWQEVLAGAYFRGDASPLHAEVSDAIAALRYAEEEGFAAGGEGAEAAEAFRIEHGLLTGEEMDRWLAHCGVGLEEFEAHFAGRRLAERFSARIGEIRRDYAPGDDEVLEAMWGAALFSGAFDAWSRSFAWRVASLVAATARPAPDGTAAALAQGAPRVPEALRAPGLLEELAAMEVLCAAAEREAGSAERCAAELRERSLQLCRIAVAEAVFPSLDQANEAYQAVTADGLGLEEVARQAGIEVAEWACFADEVPDGATALLSAPPGRVLEPQAVEGGFALQVLRRRVEPDLADPEVAARVRDRLLAAHFDALVSAHVTWSFDPWTMP